MAEQLTTDVVRSAYRLILGREPESEQVVRAALSYGSLPRLRAAFLESAEFRNGERPSAPPSRPVLVPVDVPKLDIEWQADAPTIAAMLSHIKQTWTQLGTDRPHWSVLSAEAFHPDRIGENEAAFFASGAQDCRDVVAILRRHGLAATDVPEVFEFGCGLGRVTAHLAENFAHVTACDVSASHLRRAADVIARAGRGNVDLRLAESDAFGMTKPFDLWFSRIVLQHNPPPLIALILRRALSLLAPGGIALFQVPTYAIGYRFAIADYLADIDGAGDIEMHVLPQPVVFRLLEEQGCEPLEALEDLSAGVCTAWSSTMFVARKRLGFAPR